MQGGAAGQAAEDVVGRGRKRDIAYSPLVNCASEWARTHIFTLFLLSLESETRAQ